MGRAVWGLIASSVGFALFLGLSKEPVGGGEADGNKLALSLISAGLVFAYGLRVRRFKGERAERAGQETPHLVLEGNRATKIYSNTWFQSLALGLLCVFAFMNYYRFDLKQFTTVGSYYDTTYYYLNSKYFEELGYQDLYLALLVADEHALADKQHSSGRRDAKRGRLSHIAKLRDLETYELTGRVAAVSAHRERIKAQFSAERWTQFVHDSGYFLKRMPRGEATYFFRDHGYNPPPTWTLMGGVFSEHVPVEHLKWITMLDFFLVFGMFASIRWALGVEACVFSFLWFASTASGVWPIVGQALLRFDWLAATVTAACCLKKGRHGLAGGLLAYAALVRVFPAVFFLPYGLVVLRDLFFKRTFSQEARRFVLAAGLVSVLFTGSAYARYGGETFVEAKDKLLLHGSAESYSSLRIGLGDALIYRGERTREDLRPTGGIPGKAAKLEALSPILWGSGVVAFLLMGFIVMRGRASAFFAMPLAYFLFFALTNPQYNYHNVRLLLMMWHLSAPANKRNMLGAAFLFLIEVAALTMSTTGAIAYARTSVTSVGLLIYILVQLVLLTRSSLELNKSADSPAPAPT